ncbi:MAG: 6-phospho-3-hexuloisomerase [Pseudomonadota bacterium]|jgi:6-phospho 3-hexuloisomerase
MHQKLIIDKISSVLSGTPSDVDTQLEALLDKAKRVFIAGAGRSGLVGRFFAMRLMHAGYEVFVVGEIVTPSIRSGDLLVVISGSGETETMLAFTKKAKENGASIALICTREKSTLGDLADVVLQIGKPDLYSAVKGMPMGTTFELTTLLILEATVSHLIHEKGIAEEEMRYRHANLE